LLTYPQRGYELREDQLIYEIARTPLQTNLAVLVVDSAHVRLVAAGK
jgi:hypothetical protein